MPCKGRVGREAGLPSTSVLLVLIAELITESALLGGSFGFLFLLLPLLIELNSEVQNNSVISGCLVRQRSKQADLQTSAF